MAALDWTGYNEEVQTGEPGGGRRKTEDSQIEKAQPTPTESMIRIVLATLAAPKRYWAMYLLPITACLNSGYDSTQTGSARNSSRNAGQGERGKGEK